MEKTFVWNTYNKFRSAFRFFNPFLNFWPISIQVSQSWVFLRWSKIEIIRGCVKNPANFATIQNRQNSQLFLNKRFETFCAFDKKNKMKRVFFRIYFNFLDSEALTEVSKKSATLVDSATDINILQHFPTWKATPT